ncbi:MAG TPA: FHA domain-containing protein [Myxococcales bacterium]|nr:FHA domain-containing protein [Myxococcales bacterium]
MAVVRAYLLSNLIARRGELAGEFQARFPHSWLVWEKGVWKPSPRPSKSTVTRATPRARSDPGPASGGPAPGGPAGDPLCYELCERAPFKIGRAADCDVRLNEETVSRDHLWLEPAPDGAWMVRPGSPSSITYIGGQALRGDGFALSARETLELGNVVLTFETAETLLRRVDGLRGQS